jgi:hypothetical protein
MISFVNIYEVQVRFNNSRMTTTIIIDKCMKRRESFQKSIQQMCYSCVFDDEQDEQYFFLFFLLVNYCCYAFDFHLIMLAEFSKVDIVVDPLLLE